MRVFLSCLQAQRPHAVPAYAFWEPYFKQGIEEAGHTWVEASGVDWAEGLTYADGPELRAWRDRVWSRTVAFARHAGADVFLSYLFPNQVEPTAVTQMQALGLPCVNFYCDNVRDFQAVPEVYRPFDLHWVPEHKALAMYTASGLPHIHAPMPCWVRPDLRGWDHEERYGPTFVGSRDAQREVLFAEALARGAAVELRGPGWTREVDPSTEAAPRAPLGTRLARQGRFLRDEGPVAWIRKVGARYRSSVPDSTFRSATRPGVFGDAYTDVLQQSAVAIGVNRYPAFRHPFGRPDTYSRLRDLEAPMMGACYLTEWTEGLDAMYDLGCEVETYRSAEEMVDKLERLMADPAKRREMRRLGQRRALGEHTVGRSIARIAERLAR